MRGWRSRDGVCAIVLALAMASRFAVGLVSKPKSEVVWTECTHIVASAGRVLARRGLLFVPRTIGIIGRELSAEE